MKIYKLKCAQQINKPIEEVFAFFQKPENLETITPPSLGFQILTPSPIVMAKDLKIDYQIKILGIPCYWTSHIIEYGPPNMFVDKQVRGPYALWHHQHTFEANANGTLVTDEVDYAIPLGFLGRLAHLLFVNRQLKEIFSYRKKVIEEYFKKGS